MMHDAKKKPDAHLIKSKLKLVLTMLAIENVDYLGVS